MTEQESSASIVGTRGAVNAGTLGLHEPFERCVLWLCCAEPKFWACVGRHISPAALNYKLAPDVIGACLDIEKEMGPPKSLEQTFQRLARGLKTGKYERQQLTDSYHYLLSGKQFALDIGWENAVKELAPFLRDQLALEMLAHAGVSYRRDGNLSTIIDALRSVDKIGAVNTGADSLIELNLDALKLINVIHSAKRLTYGIPEIDMELDGGMPIRSLCLLVGDTGAGKSMHLTHQAGKCYMDGKFVGLVTLEVTRELQLARLCANLVGLPINSIIDGSEFDSAYARFAEISASPRAGRMVVAEMPAKTTGVADLLTFIDRAEQQVGQKMDVLIVDYADKLGDPSSAKKEEHAVFEYIFDGLRTSIGLAKDMWVYTAAQATRPGGKGSRRMIDMGDVSASMHKPRIADVVISLNPDPTDPAAFEYFVAKHRFGRGRFKVGPIYTDFARARAYHFTDAQEYVF